MEEINDTMRYLWNKTYRGTGVPKMLLDLASFDSITRVDIDGIKICSDVESGASKRSYNYRVSYIYYHLRVNSLIGV